MIGRAKLQAQKCVSYSLLETLIPHQSRRLSAGLAVRQTSELGQVLICETGQVPS